jgi:hypothetical protein
MWYLNVEGEIILTEERSMQERAEMRRELIFVGFILLALSSPYIWLLWFKSPKEFS